MTGTQKMHTTLSPYFGIPWRTGSSSTTSCLTARTTSNMFFVALGTKSLEMYAQWMPTGSKEEQRATNMKASAFLDQIHQGMTCDINTHVCFGELKDVVTRLGGDLQDLVTCIKTLMDCCKMINDKHYKHELHCCIVHAYRHKGKLLGKLMAKPFKMPSCELADIAVIHFAFQHA